ncbi:hypothetical protein [Salinispora pacifica]|uniref:hypothetical protein n=1 Tax=Salinispora pacifica TaxID=351187 RepID=UPI0012FBAA4B|nr:hypothetical protein [Salinispora pacifica]
MIENLGFFRELPHGDAQGASLRECAGKGDVQVSVQVASYLASGAILAATGERVFDVLNAGKVDVGALALQTDGHWVWPSDLAYYVAEYNVLLPVRFIDWIRSSGWIPPQLSVDELVRVEKALLPEG